MAVQIVRIDGKTRAMPNEAATREKRLRRMSPEARATYDRIRALREEIGPLDINIVEALRELREME